MFQSMGKKIRPQYVHLLLQRLVLPKERKESVAYENVICCFVRSKRSLRVAWRKKFRMIKQLIRCKVKARV